MIRHVFMGSLVLAVALLTVVSAPSQEKKAADKPQATSQPATEKEKPTDPNLVPLELKLPKPAFKGTPQNIPPGTKLEPPRKGPRPPLMVPKGLQNVALNKPVTASDKDPIVGSLKLVTDGDKEASEGSYVELGPRLQWVQIDLKNKFQIHAILVWHFHSSARVYHDVVVQVADDPDFITNARTLFNNDHDNSSGLGVGKDLGYWETYEGKLIEAKGAVAQYVRLYSNGSTSDDQNDYVEVEVYGLPAK